MARVIFNGEPGAVFTNDTGRVLFQFVCQFANSCGVCISYARAIGPSWPIPLHRGCRCQQRVVLPGKDALPFVDFMAEIKALPPAQQAVAVGRANWQLVTKGVVDFSEVVTPQRVRTLREVVSRNRLDVGTLLKAGVNRRTAERAYQAVHTPAHELAAAHRKTLVDALAAEGLTTEQVKTAFGRRVVGRVGIASGPAGASATGRADVTAGVLESLGVKKGSVAAFAPAKGKPKPAQPVAPAAEYPAERPAEVPWNQGAAKVQELVKKMGAYAEGDRKVAELAKLGERSARVGVRAERLRVEFERLLRDNSPEAAAELDVIRASYRATLAELRGARDADRAAALPLLRVPDGLKWNDAGGTVPALPAELRGRVTEATDWLAAVASDRRLEGPVPLKVKRVKQDRAYVQSGKVHLGDDSNVVTTVHELGHVLEGHSGAVRNASQAFLKHRVGDEPVRQMRSLPGATFAAYAPDEYGRKDRFDRAFTEVEAWYTGKQYEGGTDSELTSMGLQKLYEDPAGFARRDPEYCKFILGLLDGTLR